LYTSQVLGEWACFFCYAQSLYKSLKKHATQKLLWQKWQKNCFQVAQNIVYMRGQLDKDQLHAMAVPRFPVGLKEHNVDIFCRSLRIVKYTYWETSTFWKSRLIVCFQKSKKWKSRTTCKEPTIYKLTSWVFSCARYGLLDHKNEWLEAMRKELRLLKKKLYGLFFEQKSERFALKMGTWYNSHP
jgi:hypothetical protein